MRQGKTAPNGKIIANITIKGVNALLKKGAPTDIFSSNNISINNGHKVPIKTTIVDTMRSKLLDISALSRLTKENVIFFDNSDARNENNTSATPTINDIINKSQTPRVGSFANE